MSQAKFDELRERLAEIADLVKTAALLGWDQHVMMPPQGAAIRAEQLATVGRIAHTKFISPEIGRLLDDLRDWGEQHDYDSFEASLIRVAAARLGEGAPGAAGPARRDVALGRAREPGLGRGAQERTTSRRSCPSCARTSTCASATSTASRSTTSRTTSCSTTTSAA